MKYCSHCGKEIMDEAVICTGCGCPVDSVKAEIFQDKDHNKLLTQLSERVKINAIIWLVIGILQIIGGLFIEWWILIVGVLNIVSSIRDMNYSKEILDKPVGIVENFESLTGPIITLIYNLVVGGFIGVIGSIYYFVAIRSFVMQNREAFIEMGETK